MNKVPYSSAIGSIMSAMLCTRPDVCHAISLTSRYQSDQGVEHQTAVKNILKYLKRTKEMFLVYGGDQELFVKGYIDVSWVIRPFCITILHHNLSLFIDIFYIMMQYLYYFILFCMFGNYWGCICWSRKSAEKVHVKIPDVGSSENSRKIMKLSWYCRIQP